MILNTTHKNKETLKAINLEVGESFSFAERMEKGGIGSPKMKIISASAEIQSILQINQNNSTCNAELRPNGIIMRFQKNSETYALAIPYYRLTIFNEESNSYTFHKDNISIKILAEEGATKIHNFINKIEECKNSVANTA